MSEKNWVEQTAARNALAIGRIVHYVARGSADGKFPPVCRAAVIAELPENGLPRIVVLNPQGIFFDDVEYNTAGTPGTFHFYDQCKGGS